MLIGISGSQGQGKSTVCDSLQERGFKVVQNKTSRSILSDWGYTLNEINSYQPLTVKFQDEILVRHIRSNLEAAESSDLYVSERTFADIFVYSLFVLGPFNAYSSWLDDYYHKCVEAQKMYSGIVYLTGRNYSPQNDGVRSINRHYTTAVDELISKYLSDFENSTANSCPVWGINHPDHDFRVDTICKLVQKWVMNHEQE